MKHPIWTRSLLGAALGLLVLAPGTARAQDTLRVVTLEEAVSMALESDPNVIAASGNQATARAELRQARAAFLPTMQLNSVYANSSNERFDQASGQRVSESYINQIQLGYDLFTGGRRTAERRSSAAEVGATAAQSRAQQFQTRLTTSRAFFTAAASAELVGTAQQRLERAKQQLSFAETRLELGKATRSDLLRAQLEVGNAELAVLNAESALRTARLELGRLLGVDDEVQPAAGALPARAPQLPSPDALAARAEASAPTAVAARATYTARRADTRASYNTYMPSLRVTGGYDWTGVEFPASNQSWNMRLTASIPVFNGLTRETNVARARAAERLAEARARDAAIAARNSAENAAREITSAERRVQIAANAVELAREDLRVQEERYRLGNATILDLQTSQVALADAQVGWVQARQALATAIGQLEAVLGETLTGSPAPTNPAPEAP